MAKQKFNLVKTRNGYTAATDKDFEISKTIEIGTVITAESAINRNLLFHRKYMALVNIAWEFLKESQREYFKQNTTSFRKTLEIAAGHSEPYYSIARNEWLETAKSIAFDACTQREFNELYENVKRVLYATFLRHITIDEFEKELIGF